MNAVRIQEKIKIINDAKGKPVEVILPYNTYQELLELQISMDIYRQKDTKISLQQTKDEITEGKTVSFGNIDKAIEWLDK